MRECPRINTVVEANLQAMREVTRASLQGYYPPTGNQGYGYPIQGYNNPTGYGPPPGPPPQGQRPNDGNHPSFAKGQL